MQYLSLFISILGCNPTVEDLSLLSGLDMMLVCTCLASFFRFGFGAGLLVCIGVID